jgi:hypothetical protein
VPIVVHVEVDDKATLQKATGPRSSLRRLRIGERFANRGMAALTKQIKSNTKLEWLEFSGSFDPVYGRLHFDRLANAIERHNCTLVSVRESYQRDYIPHVGLVIDHHEHGDTKMGNCLRRNRRIQHALRKMPTNANFQVHELNRWPLALELIGDKLLYKFLRHGNLQALCDVVVVVDGAAAESGNATPPTRQTWAAT